MKKFIIIIGLYLSIIQNIFSYEYNNLLLKAQINIFPKLLLFDNNIKNKSTNNTLILTIVYDINDKEKSAIIKNKMKNLFKNIGNYKLKVFVKRYENINLSDNSNAYYLLNSNPKNIKNIVNIAIKHRAFTFTYDIENLKYGILISLAIEAKTKIYFNKDYIKKYNINFNPSIFQITRFYSVR